MLFPIVGNFAEARKKWEKSLSHPAAGVSNLPTGLMEKDPFENWKFCSLTYPSLPPFVIG